MKLPKQDATEWQPAVSHRVSSPVGGRWNQNRWGSVVIVSPDRWPALSALTPAALYRPLAPEPVSAATRAPASQSARLSPIPPSPLSRGRLMTHNHFASRFGYPMVFMILPIGSCARRLGSRRGMLTLLSNVRCWSNSGNLMLALSFSAFDPNRKSGLRSMRAGRPAAQRGILSRASEWSAPCRSCRHRIS